MASLFNRLLLATEHSNFDTGAEAMAFALAQRWQRPLAAVMPLMSNPEYEAIEPQFAAHDDQEAAAKIAQLRATALAAGVTLDLRVRRGDELYREIVQEAQEQASDLLIIRRRGKRSFLANLLVGEMVGKVVAHAPCPVLVVPREARLWRQRVLAAAEPTEQGKQVVAAAAAVAAEWALPLHLVSVAPSDAERPKAEAFVAAMVAQAQREGAQAQGEVRIGKPHSEILAARAGCQADLIVMGSRGEHRMGRAVVGGAAQKVMGLSEHPVMVLHLQ